MLHRKENTRCTHTHTCTKYHKMHETNVHVCIHMNLYVCVRLDDLMPTKEVTVERSKLPGAAKLLHLFAMTRMLLGESYTGISYPPAPNQKKKKKRNARGSRYGTHHVL